MSRVDLGAATRRPRSQGPADTQRGRSRSRDAMSVCARPGCGASLAKLRVDAKWCSRACYIRAKRDAEALQRADTPITQREFVLDALREAGDDGVHTFTLRGAYVGNPSQRISELEDLGYAITHTRERLGGRSIGARYVLIGEPGEAIAA